MSVTEIVVVCLLAVLILVVLYQIKIDGYTRKKQFELQIEMAQAQQSMTKDLPWKDLKKIVDEIISFTVINYMINNGIFNMKKTELTLNWTTILNEVCAEVDLSLSDEIKRQILKTITREYMVKYIKNSVQLTVVYNLQNNKNNAVNKKVESLNNGVALQKTNK